MKKIVFISLFIVSLFFDISLSSAFTVSKKGSLFGGGAFFPVYKKTSSVSVNHDAVAYQEAIAEQLFDRTFVARKATKKIKLNEEIKKVEIEKDRPLEVQIKEYLGLQWNFDCDSKVVEYFDESKIGNKLKLYFNPKEQGVTRIYFDLVTDENKSEVLETRYLDVFIDKDKQNEESKN